MKYIITLTAITLMLSCTKKNDAFEKVLSDYHEGYYQLFPIEATFAGDDKYNDVFPNSLSDEYLVQYKGFFGGIEEKLAKIKDEDLSESEKMSKALLAWECGIHQDELKFKNFEYFPIDQFWSINLMMGQLGAGKGAQPFKTAIDYKNWLKRLDGYLLWLKSAQLKMNEGMAKGYVLPKPLIKKIIPQFEELTNEDLTKNLFFGPVLEFPASFSAAEKAAFTAEYTSMLKSKLIPEFKNIAVFFKTKYLAAGRNTSGVSALKDGNKYYDYSIKKYTTTTLSAEEIHKIGLSEVARIMAEMEKVKAQVGFKGSIIAFFDYVRNNKKLMPFTKPEEVIAHFNGIHTKMKPQLENLFSVSPKTPFEVRRTEAFREASASAEYNQGSLDGTRPGVFYVPLPDVKNYNVYSDEALFLHEAIPGHHYQVSLAQENGDLPDFRKTLWYSAYGEGWALYTESLGKELGLYTDPFQYFGMLSMEMHRAIRLVVDSGIHTKGWTREQAIKYSAEHEAEPLTMIESEIERYMANPGQALSYKIGQLKIRELRKKAETELGNKFEIKEFHKQILETGCIPLALLETKINNWIKATLAK